MQSNLPESSLLDDDIDSILTISLDAQRQTLGVQVYVYLKLPSQVDSKQGVWVGP